MRFSTRCRLCDRENARLARTCAACGARLDRGPRAVAARFLLSAILPAPVRLEPGRKYRIGRDRANDVYLPSSHISRLHAEVLERDGRWIVCDAGSKNGTFVNGERVLDRALADGDRITAGELEVLFIEATAEEARAILDGRHELLVGETRRAVLPWEELAGDLDSITIPEIVHLLHHNRKTGCLEISPPRSDPVWRLYFLKGALVHAEEENGEQGEPAARAAFRVKRGRFLFRPTKTTRLTIGKPVLALLLSETNAAAQPDDDLP